MKPGKEVSNRIATLRPLLIVGVVFVHVSGLADKPSEIDPTLFNLFASFFKNGIFRGTVPTMSLIAGFLLFNAGLDQHPSKLFRKKFMTLVIPFVIFNLVCLAFMMAMNAVFGMVFPALPDLRQPMHAVLSRIFGLHDYPINAPLHFVRDMIVTMMLVPVLGKMIRYAPMIGLVALAIIFGTNQDGDLIFRASSLLLFYIGGVAAVYKWNVLALDRYAGVSLLLLLVICAATIGLRFDNNTVLVMTAPFLIWSSVALLRHSWIEVFALRVSKYSFFIFAAHMPLLGLTWWATVNYARWIPYPLYWMLTPILIVTFLKKTYDAAMYIVPTAFNFAIGARATVPVFEERRKTYRPNNAPVYSPETRMRLTHS
jgi:succinoglycan biosynthesis protein ExoH